MAATITALSSGRQRLVDHLRASGAPDAAARLGGPPETPFAAAEIRVVDDAASARACAAALSAAASPDLLALDCEWRPDGSGEDNAPALAQVALASGGTCAVYLVDLTRDTGAIAALADALASDRVAKVGFGVRGDVDKLARHFPSFARAARRVVDLRVDEGGLGAAVARWLPGVVLDKAEQCSDWSERPLTAAQTEYAAADAAVLVDLFRALREAGVPLPERNISPTAARATPSLPAAAAVDVEAIRARAKAIAPGAEIVTAEDAGEGGLVVNALCVETGAGDALVVFPAAERCDTKWLAFALNRPRSRVALAPREACADRFGAPPGSVPPFPLRDAVRAFAHPALLAEERVLVGGGGAPGWRCRIRGADLAAFAESLPDPRLWRRRLDAALAARPLRLTLDSTLAPVARRLRMIGVDAAVAGELLRERGDATAMRRYRRGGVSRVRVDAARAADDFREAALAGRALVVRNRRGVPNAYAVLAADGEAQFEELLDVLDLRGAVAEWGSRCGICNGDDWRQIDAAELEDAVPPAVLRGGESDFYRCGKCGQVFWPGAKYGETMATLRGLALNETHALGD